MKLPEGFLSNTDESGRFIVVSQRTGKTYAIEPIDDGNIRKWGDMDPATKKLTGSYGQKYRGAIDAKDSLITEDNGFKNIITLPPGTSPLLAIEAVDAKYPDKVSNEL